MQTCAERCPVVDNNHNPCVLYVFWVKLQVLLDEYNAKPMPVTVTGSAVAGLARDRLIAAGLSSSSGSGGGGGGSSSNSAGMLQQTGQLAGSAVGTICNRGGGTTRGGEQRHEQTNNTWACLRFVEQCTCSCTATDLVVPRHECLQSLTGELWCAAGAGGGDAYTVRQQQQQTLGSSSKTVSTLQRSTLLPALPNWQQPEVLQGDTWFPATLSTQYDVNCVLTQQPGKLRTKDIKVSWTDGCRCCFVL
jgi:hypothetical protein